MSSSPKRKKRTGGPVRGHGVSRDLVFQFVRDRLLAGEPPTIREVQEGLKFQAVQTARDHLTLLVEEGRLIKLEGVSRGYRLPIDKRTPPTYLVPVLGQVQAGAPSLAVEDVETYIPVQSRYPHTELFALRVKGESMTGAGIFDGDLVVVRRQPMVVTGEIVVALVGDEATVKTLRQRRKNFYLQPENPDFEAIEPESFTLLGRVIEVRRSLDQ
jgi:repressor LexA